MKTQTAKKPLKVTLNKDSKVRTFVEIMGGVVWDSSTLFS